MSAIVPNWTKIAGKVVGVQNVVGSPTLALLRVVVAKKSKHEGFPDLVRAGVGDELGVRTTRVVADRLGVKVEDKVEGVVRAAGGELYYFDPESITVNKP